MISSISGNSVGKSARRCLPVHFPRYQLEREEDCIDSRATLLELLRRVPLECSAERWVTDHWLYFYECSVGCIGILKDWLLRAVSTALDDGTSRLSLDCVQDHALPVDIYRQMALDAYEGEQRLNHTEAIGNTCGDCYREANSSLLFPRFPHARRHRRRRQEHRLSLWPKSRLWMLRLCPMKRHLLPHHQPRRPAHVKRPSRNPQTP